MQEYPFTISGAIRKGWELTKANLLFLIVYQIILYALLALTGSTQDNWEWSLGNFLGWLLVIICKMGLYNSSLLISSGIKPGFDQLYRNWRQLFSWVVASVLFGLMLGIGLMLFIVPGLYVWATYGFYPYFILDKESGPLEALHQAAEATKGIRWPVFLLFLACLGLNLVGALFFGIGLFITVPITLIALAIVYRQITPSTQEIIQPTEIISN